MQTHISLFFLYPLHIVPQNSEYSRLLHLYFCSTRFALEKRTMVITAVCQIQPIARCGHWIFRQPAERRRSHSGYIVWQGQQWR